MNYFKIRDAQEERLNRYINELKQLSLEELEILLTKVDYKQENTTRNNIHIYNPIPNIEEVIIEFIEQTGKGASYEYALEKAKEDEEISTKYQDVEVKLIKTNKRYWCSSYIMGKTWFEPFNFKDIDRHKSNCRKCNKRMLLSEAFYFYDENNSMEGVEIDYPEVYIYCEEHYREILKQL